MQRPTLTAEDNAKELLNIYARIPQISRLTLARNLRQTLGKEEFGRSTCQSDRGTQWVTAKKGICGSISTAD